jgi:hypothetical protein
MHCAHGKCSEIKFMYSSYILTILLKTQLLINNVVTTHDIKIITHSGVSMHISIIPNLAQPIPNNEMFSLKM